MGANIEITAFAFAASLLPFAFLLLPFVSTTLGVLVLMLVAYDVYATILHARARGGPVSETLNRNVWRATRFIAFRLTRPRRHRLLNAVGPLLLPSLIIAFIILLIIGFGLIYFPHMPSAFLVEHENGGSPWFDSLYFSGVTLTTVGYGDILPRTIAMRFVALLEGATGFALISLGVTYLLTVYRALERKRAVALSFYHQAEEGADVAGFITHHFVSGRFYGLETALRTAARDLQELLESHVEHPIIHYFHPVEVHKSMPRIIFLSLETCAVIHSCLDEEVYSELINHPEVRTLELSSLHVLKELVASLHLERRAAPRHETPAEEEKRWRRRYRQTLRQLQAAGIQTRHYTSAGWETYRARREEWETQLRRFSTFLGYEWDEITGDRDLRYASDEEMEEPEVTGNSSQ